MSTFGSVARTLSDVEGVAARGHAAAHGGAADHDGAHWVEAGGRRGLHEDQAFHGGLGVSVEQKAPHEHGHFAVHTGAGREPSRAEHFHLFVAYKWLLL